MSLSTPSAYPARIDPVSDPLPRIRSLLFCPASRPERIAKFVSSGTDAGVADLEDGVAPAGKLAARAACREAVEAVALADPGFPIFVRVNKVGSEWFDGDIELIGSIPAAGVVLPKVESASDVGALRGGLARYGREGLPLIAGIETARGVVGIGSILTGARVDAVYFGAEDFVADVEGVRTPAGLEVLYARSHVAVHSRVAGIPCLDQVVVRLEDDAGFEADAAMGRSLGYQGKMCLHPRQVELANRTFSPTPAEIESARRLVEAYDAAAATGSGVIRLDGEMIDEPLVRRARSTLRAAGQEVDINRRDQ
jgi:citrate lyase subunit beta/citryl-CoA lyase